MARINVEDHIDINIINDAELQKLFTELIPSVQNKVVFGGMRTAAGIIKNRVLSIFDSVKKNKSKTNYKAAKKELKIENMKSGIGVKVGYTKEGFKYRWIQWGTKDRYYKKGVKRSIWRKKSDQTGGHFTGALEKTDFFYKAVRETSSEAQNKVSQAILESLEKTVRKYEK